MDEKTRLLSYVFEALEKEGFEVSERCDIRPSCFDLFARRHILLLLLKILTNIDGLTQAQAMDLTRIAGMVSASPLLVGEKTRTMSLEDGILYDRYGIPTVTPGTLENAFLKGVMPFIVSMRGGYYVRLDSEKLKKTRAEQDLSLGDVARKMGVSRKTVYAYENEGRSATFEAALRLEEFLDVSIVKPIDLFGFRGETPPKAPLPSDPSLEKLHEIGFDIHSVKKAPFDAIALESHDIIFTKVLKKRIRDILKKALIMHSISETTKKDAFFVSERDVGKTNIAGMPIIEKGELEKVGGSDELLEMIWERKGRR